LNIDRLMKDHRSLQYDTNRQYSISTCAHFLGGEAFSCSPADRPHIGTTGSSSNQ
jgi:hypothetical protein